MKEDNRAVHSRAILHSDDRARDPLSVQSLLCATSNLPGAAAGFAPPPRIRRPPPQKRRRDGTMSVLYSCAWREGMRPFQGFAN